MANIDIEKTLRQSTGRYQPAKAAQAAAGPVRIDVGQTMANRRRQLEGLGIRTATERRKPEAAQPHPALERMVNGESGQRVVRYQDYPRAVQSLLDGEHGQRVVRYQDYPQAVRSFLDGEHGAAHSRRPGASGGGFGEGGGFSADTPLKPKSEFAEYDERVNAKTGNPIINTIDAVLDADMVGSSAVTGMAVFNNLVAQTANLIPGVIADATGTENKFLTQKLADFTGRNLDQLSRKTAEDASRHGTAGAVVSNLVSGTASALPNAVLAVLSGGGSAVAQLAPHASGIAEAVSSGVRTMAQNPMYWSSFISTVGSEYEEAAANGADAGPALVAALTSSLLGSAVEVGGGLETLPGELRGADVNRLAAWLKSGLDEGTEEVIQDLISGVAQKALVDSGKPWASMADDGAVVNPGRLAQAFGMGAGVGLILGGGQDLAVNAINQAAAANSPAVQQAAAGTVDGQEYIANIRAKNINRELVSTETEPSMQTSAVQEQPV